MNLKHIIHNFSKMEWLYDVINVYDMNDYDELLVNISRKQTQRIIPIEEYKALDSDSDSIDYGYYISNIHYELNNKGYYDYDLLYRIIYFLNNCNVRILKRNDSLILKEILNFYIDMLIYNGFNFKRTNILSSDIKKLINLSKRMRKSANIIFTLPEIYGLNELNRIINNVYYLNKFKCVNGKITLLAGIYGSFELKYLVNMIGDKTVGAIFADNMYDDARLECISGLTGIKQYIIKDFKFDSRDLEELKEKVQEFNRKIWILFDYYLDFENFENDFISDDLDLIVVYRLRRGMRNKNKFIQRLKELSIKTNKPIVIIYHSRYTAEHEINLNKINELNLELCDYIYGFVPGVNGFLKLK